MSDGFDADDVRRAVREAYRAGDVDALNAGVPLSTIAERLDRTRKNQKLRELIRDLCRYGDLEVVHGVDPETRQVRTSYRPADADDDPPDILA